MLRLPPDELDHLPPHVRMGDQGQKRRDQGMHHHEHVLDDKLHEVLSLKLVLDLETEQ